MQARVESALNLSSNSVDCSTIHKLYNFCLLIMRSNLQVKVDYGYVRKIIRLPFCGEEMKVL
jgi:hypothetical protein